MANSVFEQIFGPGLFTPPPQPEIRPEILKALRCAANAWLKDHREHPQAGLVKAALVATNPR